MNPKWLAVLELVRNIDKNHENATIHIVVQDETSEQALRQILERFWLGEDADIDSVSRSIMANQYRAYASLNYIGNEIELSDGLKSEENVRFKRARRCRGGSTALLRARKHLTGVIKECRSNISMFVALCISALNFVGTLTT